MVTRARMYEKYNVLDAAVRKLSKPVEPTLSEHIDGPPHNRRRVIVEPFEDFRTGARAVVIADERQPTAVGHLVDTLLRVTAVTDDISQAEGFVHRRAV